MVAATVIIGVIAVLAIAGGGMGLHYAFSQGGPGPEQGPPQHVTVMPPPGPQHPVESPVPVNTSLPGPVTAFPSPGPLSPFNGFSTFND